MLHSFHRVFNQMTRQCSRNSITSASTPQVTKGKGKEEVTKEEGDEDEDEDEEDEEMDEEDDDDEVSQVQFPGSSLSN